ncbi:plasminogen-like, partial [Dendronephthya gigantea]|uniref:plasminogen-like n=1 Tax=Dendronephthya gigantea TaxID=151771 RepID=UPI001069B373
MCDRVYKLFRCHFFFPGCDWTQSVFRRRKICRKTCLVAKRKCYNIWTFVRDLVDTPQTSQKTKELFNCEKEEPYISRNAGDTPECWYYDFRNPTDESSSAREWKINADCLYLNGSSYHGNISVTDSGTPCQSWTEQCPHRHTMNTTYPELNNAKNYCRNPKNSGKRPWCFTTDRNKRWEYCDIPKCIPVDGGYSNWTIKSACSVTCGEGLQTWTRVCKNPEPKFGGRDCSHFGERDEYRPCFVKPCIVNGGFSTWSLSIPCNVSCGGGVEIWKRSCDNPEPKYGGRNCSRLGNSMELRSCNTMPCPIDGNYSNWTRASPCSVTCGEGVEVWIRECDNPPGEYGGNCSKQGPDQERRSCRNEACPVSSEEIGVIAIVASFLLVAAIT